MNPSCCPRIACRQPRVKLSFLNLACVSYKIVTKLRQDHETESRTNEQEIAGSVDKFPVGTNKIAEKFCGIN